MVCELDLTVEFKCKIRRSALPAYLNISVDLLLTILAELVYYSVLMDFDNVNSELQNYYLNVLTFVFEGSYSYNWRSYLIFFGSGLSSGEGSKSSNFAFRSGSSLILNILDSKV